jgi:hypothetical protein
MTRGVIIVFACVMSSGCHHETQSAVDSSRPAEVQGAAQPVAPSTNAVAADTTFAAKAAVLDAYRDSMVTVLRHDSGTGPVDSIYEALRARYDSLVYHVAYFANAYEQTLYAPHRARCAQRPSGDSSTGPYADSIVCVLNAHGMSVSRAEGMADVLPNDSLVAAMSMPYLTPAMQRYLRAYGQQSANPMGGDGDIAPTWDELYRSLDSLDQFLGTTPPFYARRRVMEMYSRTLAGYFRGFPNRPAFSRRTGAFDPNLLASYRDYVAGHPASQSGRLVAEYLEILTASNYKQSPAAQKFVATLPPWADR